MTHYYALHYHMKNCGVKFVIDNIFQTLKKNSNFKLNLLYSQKEKEYFSEKINSIDIPELSYSKERYSSKEELDKDAKLLAQKIISKMDFSNNCILHCHNVNLLKNTILGRAVQFISEEKKEIQIIIQVHDFAEDHRPKLLELMQNATGKKDLNFANKLAYPINNNIKYCTINSRDKKLLEEIGISDVFLFANNIDCDFFMSEAKTKGLISKIEKYAKENQYNFDSKRRILLSPLKIIKRKNIIETLLILQELNKIKDEWQLLITLDASSSEDIEHSKKIKRYIKENGLFVTIGFGFEFISPNIKRTEEFPWNLRDVFEISSQIITTSKKEGFGMSYIEGWVANKPVIGRRIDYIFKDFEENGINLNYFYDEILVDNKDFKEFLDDEQIEILKKGINLKNQLDKTLKFINNPNREIILKNKKIIIEKYSLKGYHKNFREIIESKKYSGNEKTHIDNKKLIEYFEKND